MSENITVKINLEGVEEFKRELKTIRSELNEIVELRNRALRPRWITRLKNFVFGVKLSDPWVDGKMETTHTLITGCDGKAHLVPNISFKK